MRCSELFEDAATVLYHGTRKQFHPGDFLVPQKGYVQGGGYTGIEKKARIYCENVLEHYRPPSAVSRSKAVYMCARVDQIEYAGGYEDFVYRVEPIGPVSMCNLYWYSMLEGLCFHAASAKVSLDENDLQQMARGYWGAKPNDLGEPERDLIEYLAGSARIVDLVSKA